MGVLLESAASCLFPSVMSVAAMVELAGVMCHGLELTSDELSHVTEGCLRSAGDAAAECETHTTLANELEVALASEADADEQPAGDATVRGAPLLLRPRRGAALAAFRRCLLTALVREALSSCWS